MKSDLAAALHELREKRMVLLVDDAASPAPIYLMGSAADTTADDICLMVNHGRGVVCAAMPEARVLELGLPMMVPAATERACDFTVSVEARQGVTTGISAADRARTLNTLATTAHARLDLVTPGHIFPLRAKKGGVLVRNSPAEGAVDLLSLAGLPQVAAIMACLDANGALATEAELPRLSAELQLVSVRLSDIARHRLATEAIIEKIAEARMPTRDAGVFQAVCFRSKTDGAEHLALVRGTIAELDADGKQRPLLARVQAQNPIGDLLGTHVPGTRNRLLKALKRIDGAGRGVLVYVRHPRKGSLQEQTAILSGSPEKAGFGPSAQLREYGIGAQILSFLGAKRVVLLSSATKDIRGIDVFDLEIVGQEAL